MNVEVIEITKDSTTHSSFSDLGRGELQDIIDTVNVSLETSPLTRFARSSLRHIRDAAEFTFQQDVGVFN